MLSWSSGQSDAEVDLCAVAAGDGDSCVPLGTELLAFASAAADLRADCADTTHRTDMNAARAALVAAGGRDLMIDAAAVAANFHMMTRLADGTGARYPTTRLDAMSSTIDQMGNAAMISRR